MAHRPTLDRNGTAVIVARRGASKRTVADVYAGIARAWFQMHPASRHLENPMQKYAVAPGFAQQVWGRTDVDPQEIIVACATIVSVEKWRLTKGQQTAGCGKLQEALDPTGAWWQPLHDTDELGVHYWILAVGIIELRSVGPVDDPPPAIWSVHRKE
jgi:hypothetical protein